MSNSTEDLTGLSRDEVEGGTGVHLGAKEADRLRAEFERDEKRVNGRIAELRSLL